MPEDFIALDSWLHVATSTVAVPPDEPDDENLAPVVAEAPADDDDAIRDVRYFHAHLREALERAVHELREEIALTVIGRELERGCDLDALIADACDRYGAQTPLRVRAHPDECLALRDRYAVFPDETLRRGDAIVELNDGTVDMTLGARVARLLVSG